jgi:hypothetical protein
MKGDNIEVIVSLVMALLPVAFVLFLSTDVFGKNRKRIATISALVYFGSYFVLSLQGQYLDGNHGGSDNRATWYALYCGEKYYKPTGRIGNFVTPLGAFFWPLALVDANLIHPEKEI